MTTSETLASVLAGKPRGVWSIRPDASVYDAILLMAQKGIGALTVMDGERLAGIISERDYARKVALRDRSSKTTRVEEIMTPYPQTMTPDHTVADAMRLMTEMRIRHLPVVEGGQVAGIVTIGDLVKWLASLRAETIGHLQAYIAGNYSQ